MALKEGCTFCYPKTSNFSHFRRYGKEKLDQFIVVETDDYLVKPDILPGNPDGCHMLIFPKNHIYNLSSLKNHKYRMGTLIKKLENKFGDDFAIFEHGGTGEGNNIQSVYHAHSHIYWGLGGFDLISYMKDMLSGKLDGVVYPYKIVPAPSYVFTENL